MKRSYSDFRYRLLALVLAICALPCLIVTTSFAQESARNRGGITDIEATAVINLRIEVHAADQPIAIPYCGEDGAGELFLCNGESHLEISRRGNWIYAMPRKGLAAVMGSEPDDGRKRLLISPGKTVYFVFTVDKDFFGIATGEHLQMKINTWKSPESIGSRDSQIILTSPEFDCP